MSHSQQCYHPKVHSAAHTPSSWRQTFDHLKEQDNVHESKHESCHESIDKEKNNDGTQLERQTSSWTCEKLTHSKHVQFRVKVGRTHFQHESVGLVSNCLVSGTQSSNGNLAHDRGTPETRARKHIQHCHRRTASQKLHRQIQWAMRWANTKFSEIKRRSIG